MGIQIINGGFLTTIQDMGRYGYQETGMSVSGVMDTRAASLANILVGNDMNEAVIEITMMGPTMKFTEDLYVRLHCWLPISWRHGQAHCDSAFKESARKDRGRLRGNRRRADWNLPGGIPGRLAAHRKNSVKAL